MRWLCISSRPEALVQATGVVHCELSDFGFSADECKARQDNPNALNPVEYVQRHLSKALEKDAVLSASSAELAQQGTSLLDLVHRLVIDHVLLVWDSGSDDPTSALVRQSPWVAVLRTLPDDVPCTLASLSSGTITSSDASALLTASQTLPEDTHGIFDAQSGRRLPLASELRDGVQSLEALKRLMLSYVLEEELPDRASQVYHEPDPSQGSVKFWIRVAEPYISEEAASSVHSAVIARCVSSSGSGPEALSAALRKHFSEEIACVEPCSSGFDALRLAMLACGIGEEDEVIAPSFTFIAVHNAIVAVGATPVLVDCAPGDYNPGRSQLEAAGTSRTKAIIISHTYGVSADIASLRRLCDERSWYLIEDISEAIGASAEGRPLGVFGDFAASSLFANKLITAGDGGFVLARHSRFARPLKRLISHGGIFGRGTYQWRYAHPVVGPNCKISGLAASLCAPMVRDIPKLVEQRRQLAEWYRSDLSNHDILQSGDENAPDKVCLKLMPLGPNCTDVPWLVGIHCASASERDALRKYLSCRGIETRRYFLPVHLQPCYAGPDLQLQNSEQLASTGLSLPTHWYMTREDVRAVSLEIYKFYSEVQKLQMDDRSQKVTCNGYVGDSLVAPIAGHHP